MTAPPSSEYDQSSFVLSTYESPFVGFVTHPFVPWMPTESSSSEHFEPPNKKQTNVPDRGARDDSLFWNQYVKEADLFDKELVKGLGGDLDALLIFAGLFSAVNTAFIIESYQDLKPDPAESGGTNDLLRTLIQAVNNSTSVTTPPADFIPSSHTVIVNALFFASLLCSLFSAFGAVLAKQWLNEYERTGDDNRAPHARSRQRHVKYLGMQKYRCEVVMQALGIVLQISLLLFFVALTTWLWGINHTIGIIAIVGVVITFSFYLITTAISIYDPASPFSTRFSTILREFRPFAKPSDAPIATGMDRLDGKCIAWVSSNATMFESVAGMARVAVRLPDDIREDEKFGHTHVGPKLLRSIISSNAIPFGLTNGSLFSTVNTIRNAMTSWQGVPVSLACDVLAQLHGTLRTAVHKDPLLRESIALILEHVDIDIPRDLLIQTRRPAYETLVDLVLTPSLTLEGKRAALSLLWRYSFRSEGHTWMWPGNTMSLQFRLRENGSGRWWVP
ncbi:hypothetical protein FRB93_007068 [Tulasnella sp. JGI-2019a]|nr:hypothetical protein FRB93_007068 [Tulasnella sp. JGI-2019a]